MPREEVFRIVLSMLAAIYATSCGELLANSPVMEDSKRDKVEWWINMVFSLLCAAASLYGLSLI